MTLEKWVWRLFKALQRGGGGFEKNQNKYAQNPWHDSTSVEYGLLHGSKADAQDLAADYNTVEFNRKRGGLQTLKVPLAEIIEIEEVGFNKAMPSICHWFVAEFLPMYAPDMVNRFVADKVAYPHVYIRLVPDISEVKNSLQERKKAGFHGDTFTGVPVFQSDALKVRDDGSPNNLSPAFFRKATLYVAKNKQITLMKNQRLFR